MIFELAGRGAFNRPVPGIVDSRREFVREQLVIDDKQFQGQHTHIVQVIEQAMDIVGGRFCESRLSQRRTGCAQYAVDMHVFTDRIDGYIAADAANADAGNFVVERDPLFGNQGLAAERLPCGIEIAGIFDNALSLAVVSQPPGLD